MHHIHMRDDGNPEAEYTTENETRDAETEVMGSLKQTNKKNKEKS